MMRPVLKTAGKLMPRAFRWRIGRALYMDARGDIPNDMATNGELFLQWCTVDSWLRRGNSGCRFVAFDVGANRGDWVEHLLSQFPSNVGQADVSVVAFEPDPVASVHLSNRFARENRIKIEQTALSSESGSAKFYVSGPASGTNSLHISDKRCGNVIDVPTETLDRYCKRHSIQRVDLVKCDTEGNDCEVIRGALGMLASGMISVFQFEYNSRWIFARKFLKDVFDAIAGLPYTLCKLQPDYVIAFDSWHFELERYFEGNYVLLHQRVINWFPVYVAKWNSSNAMELER